MRVQEVEVVKTYSPVLYEVELGSSAETRAFEVQVIDSGLFSLLPSRRCHVPSKVLRVQLSQEQLRVQAGDFYPKQLLRGLIRH